jgi:uncharacterized Zn finger protein
MESTRDCPHCASSDLDVIAVEHDEGPALAVLCKECGMTGPRSSSSDPAHAMFAFNQRAGWLSLVK